MNIVTAVAKELRGNTDVTSLARVDKFAEGPDVSQTGLVAVVISVAGSWGRSLQTARYPRVAIMIHADVSRDANGNKLADDQYDRALEVYKRVDAVLHRPTRETATWGGTGGAGILGSERETEPSWVNRPGDTVASLRSTYDLKIL